MSAPTRYPLAWPAHRPRTKYRKSGQFSHKASDGWMKPVTTAMAMDRLQAEVERLGGQYPLLSSNLELNLKGIPRADRGAPVDPGVCLYFTLKGKPMAMACDTFSEVAQNIAALAAHIEATRKIERYGVASAAETLQAFAALPPPMVTEPPWREVLGFDRTSPPTKVQVEATYRLKAKACAHNEAALKTLNIARDRALQELNQ